MAMPVSIANAHDGSDHHLIIHVDENDPSKMNLAMNNAANVTSYYAGKGQKVKIEIVAYGPGLMMLRPDKSPVADRIKHFAGSFDNITFDACGNTMQKMSKKEGTPVKVYDFAQVVPSGVIQIMTRQDEGWHYLRP
ncbi:DsrE family protein [Thalassospiraceae bacterium LMO-JJ14]|nr:DsrE family protein [Thalassospiraceae bacterium LMO-JJ14]